MPYMLAVVSLLVCFIRLSHGEPSYGYIGYATLTNEDGTTPGSGGNGTEQLLSGLFPTYYAPIEDCRHVRMDKFLMYGMSIIPNVLGWTIGFDLNLPTSYPTGQIACDELSRDVVDQVLHWWLAIRCTGGPDGSGGVLFFRDTPIGARMGQRLTCKNGTYQIQSSDDAVLMPDDGGFSFY